jgi:hypothetical protein
LKPTPATGPEVDMLILQANLARMKAHLEELATLENDDEQPS